MSLEGILTEVNPPVFTQNFWGDKNAGFDVLNQNLKSACRSTADFVDFLRESCAVDDTYYKALTKLAKLTGSYQTVGTFKPCWGVIRQLVEQISQLHASFAQDLQNLMKDVQKYLEEQQKQQKSIKDSEGSTQEVVHAFRASSLQLQKAKVVYHTRFAEYQRLVRNESTSAREQEKMEEKLKKAQHEYKYLVEKYNNLRTQFVNKMRASCVQHQEIEATHLAHMREFLVRFGSSWSAVRDSLDRVCAKFTQDMGELTVDRLLDTFVKERGTGSSMPLEVNFEDVEVASLFASTDKNAGMVADNALSTGFGPEFRVSSALAVCDPEVKNNGLGSVASLTDASADSASVQSVPLNGLGSAPSMLSKPAPTLGSKRSLFKRQRQSPHERSPDVVPPQSTGTTPRTTDIIAEALSPTTQHRSSGSLSAFNLVARLGTRHIGSSSNGKEKSGGRSSRNAQPNTQDWPDDIPVEMPKDEEGYSIPPSDPWSSTVDDLRSESGHTSSDSAEEIDVIGRSFKGLKVEIRPAGELAPPVSAQILSPPPDISSAPHRNSQRALVPVLNDRRRSGGRAIHSTKPATAPLKPVLGNSQLARLPLAPALPPPPGAMSTTGSGGDASKLMDSKLAMCVSPGQARHISRRRQVGLQGSTFDTVSPAAISPPAEPSSDRPPIEWPDHPSSDGPGAGSLSGTPTLGTASSVEAQSHTNWFSFGSDSDGVVTTARPSTDGSTSTLVNWPTSPLSWSASFSPRSPKIQPSPPARQSFRLLHPPLTTEANGFSTLQRAESVAVAAAFVETWQARFFNGGGSSFSTAATLTPPPQQTVLGSLTLAFPTLAVKQLTAGSLIGGPLVLRLGNSERLRNIQLQLPGALLSDGQTDPSTAHTVTIPDSVLTQHLVERVGQTTGSSSSSTSSPQSVATVPYVSLPVLAYEVDLGSTGSTNQALVSPISLCTYWRCERDTTDFRLDYATHWPSDSVSPSPHNPQGELHVAMPVDGHVTRMQSLPVGAWLADALQAVWKIPLNATSSPSPQTVGARPTNSSGTIRAKFLLEHGPGRPQPVTLRFVREDCLASGLRLTVESPDYRLSLCKRRLVGDQYVCEPPSHSSRFQLNRPGSPRLVDFKSAAADSASSIPTPSQQATLLLPPENDSSH